LLKNRQNCPEIGQKIFLTSFRAVFRPSFVDLVSIIVRNGTLQNFAYGVLAQNNTYLSDITVQNLFILISESPDDTGMGIFSGKSIPRLSAIALFTRVQMG
jgi:hypothetical protein